VNTLNRLTPGENISAVARVIDEQKLQIVRNKKIIKLKVGDATNIANLVAWEPQTKKIEKINLNKGDIVEIKLGLCPKSHKTAAHPPAITVTQSTILKKTSAKDFLSFPSVDDCMKIKFLDELCDYQYAVVRVFISRVFNTVVYFCDKCKKFSDKMCDCGNFPDAIFSISGAFSDGTRTLPFTTMAEGIAEKMTNLKKSDSEKIDAEILMNRPFTLFGYLRNDHFYVEEVIEE
jgi:hypothetical protein